MPAPLLSVKNLTLRRDEGTGSALFHDVSFDVNEGEFVVIKGRSGSGKTTLLKCIAQLVVYQKGEIQLRGKTPAEYGIPTFRTKVLYVPQRPSLLPGTPTDFLKHIQTFSSRASHPSSAQKGASSWLPSFLGGKKGAIELPEGGNDAGNGSSSGTKDEELDPYELSKEWNISRFLWDRSWGDLSGGEAQRISLACALGRGSGLGGGGEVILLDEPTSALDSGTASQVEKSLLALLPPSSHNPDGKGSKDGPGPKAFLLITHSQEQADRLAGKGAKVVDLGEGDDERASNESGGDDHDDHA